METTMTPSAGSVALTQAGYYILLSLQVQRHGYGRMQFVQELSRVAFSWRRGHCTARSAVWWEKCGWKQWKMRTDERESVLTPIGQAVLEAELVMNGKQWIGGGQS